MSAPTQPVSLLFSNITGTGFQISWSGGLGAASYSYTLNTVSSTPSQDNGLSSQSATFSSLAANSVYNLVVTATNSNGSTSGSATITLLPSAVTSINLYSDAIDAGSSPQTLTVNGSIVYTTVNGYQSAYFANSSSNYISLPFTGYGQTAFTISVWFYAINGGRYSQWSLSKVADGTDAFGCSAKSLNGEQLLNLVLSSGTINAGNYLYASSSGVWYQLVLTVNQTSNTYRSYVNGVLQNSISGSGSLLNSNYLLLGAAPLGTYQGIYNSSVSYVVDDIVQVSGTSYILAQPPTTQTIPSGLGQYDQYSMGTFSLFPSKQVWSVCRDSRGNFYTLVSDNKVYKITSTTQVVFAGSGQAGSVDGTGTNARFQFDQFSQITSDASGNLYLTSTGSNIRKITPAAVVTTLVTGLSTPSSISIDANFNIYYLTGKNTVNAKLYKYPSNEIMSLPFVRATFVDSSGYIYYASNSGFTSSARTNIYKTVFNGTPVVYGNIPTSMVVNGVNITSIGGGAAYGITVDDLGDVYYSAAPYNNSLFKINRSQGSMNTTYVTGYAGNNPRVNGLPAVAQASYMVSIIIDPNTYTIYFADFNGNAVRIIPQNLFKFFCVGTPVSPGLSALNGYLKDMQIFNSEFTSSQVTAVYDQSSPAQVSTITRGAVSSTTGSFSWNAAQLASLYSITLSPSSPSISNTTNTNVTLTGLSANTQYTLGVLSMNTYASSPATTLIFTTAPGAVTAITQTSATSTSLTVSWTAGAGATSYSLGLTDTSANLVTATPSTISSSPVTFTGLTANKSYLVTITSVNANGSTAASPFTGITGPSAPTSLQKSSVTRTGFVTSWTAGAGATSYTVSLTDNSGNLVSFSMTDSSGNNQTISPFTSAASPVTFSGLSENTLYKVIIHSVNVYASTASSVLSVTTAPAAPTSLLQVSATSTTVTYSWSGAEGATSYTYNLRDSSGNIPAGLSYSSTTASPVTVSGLLSNNAYTILITSVNTNGSTVSSSLSLRTAPSSPTGLVKSLVTIDQFSVSWTSVSGATSYTLGLTDPAGAPVSFGFTDSSGNPLTQSPYVSSSYPVIFTGLSANTAYKVSISSTNAYGSSSSSTLSVTTAPGAPVNLNQNSSTSTSVILSWSGASGATSYSYSITTLANASVPGVSYSSYTANPVTISGLYGNSSYYIVVTATNTNGSTSSAAFQISTPPGVPTNLTQLSSTPSTITISWTGGLGASSYTFLLIDSSNNTIPVTPSSSLSSPVTFTGLSVNNKYTVTVSAVGTYTTASASFFAYTPPSAPTDVSQTSATGSSITVSWSAVANVSMYLIGLKSEAGQTLTPSTLSVSNVTSVSLTGLTINTGYYITVSSTNSFGTSAAAPFRIQTGPQAPTGVQEITANNQSITVAWFGAAGATSYSFLVTDASGNPVSVTASTYTSSPTILTGFSQNALYSLIVTSMNVYGTNTSTPINLVSAPLAPSGLTQISATSSSIQVGWSSQIGISSFLILLKNTQNQVILSETSLSLSTIQYVFNRLTLNTQYFVILSSVNLYGTSSAAVFSITTGPGAPTSLRQISATSKTVTVAWSGSSGATSFSYSLTDLTGNPLAVSFSSVSANTVTVDGLSTGKVYIITITSINIYGSTPSQALSIYTIPDAPTYFTQNLSTESTLSIAWKLVTGASYYSYELLDSSGSILIDTAIVKLPQLFLSDLNPGTLYTLRVLSSNPYGTSDPLILKPATTPRPPQTLIQASATLTTATFEWSGDLGALSYTLNLTDASGTRIPASYSQTLATSTPITLNGLTGNTTYNLVITAVGIYDLKASKTFQISTAPNPPASLLQVTSTNTTITVVWPKNTEATSFILFLNGLQVATISTSLFSRLMFAASEDTSNNSYTITGLLPNNSYSLTIQTLNAYGSSISNAFPCTTGPAAATSVQVSSLTYQSFSLSWVYAAGATSYTTLLEDSTGQRIDLRPSVFQTSPRSFSGLTGNKSYTLILYSVNEYGRAESSPVSFFLPAPLPPCQPSNLIYTGVASTQIQITWTARIEPTNILGPTTSYRYTLNGIAVTPILDKGLTNQTVILPRPDPTIFYTIYVIAVNQGHSVSSLPLQIPGIITKPSQIPNSKVIVHVFRDFYNYSFGDFVKGSLNLLQYALQRGCRVRLNVAESSLSNLLIVENHDLAGSQVKLYESKDSKLLADDLYSFMNGTARMFVLATNIGIHRNEIDNLSILELNRLIQYTPLIQERVTERLSRDLLNGYTYPSITEPYCVLNMYLSDLNLDRAQIQQLAVQVRNSINTKKNHIVITNNEYLRKTLTEFMGGFHTLNPKVLDTLTSLESSVIDFILVSKSSQIYTFREYNVKSKLKKLPFELNETTSLTSLKFGPMYYITSTVANASSALLYPNAAVSDPDGNLFIADTVNEGIKKISGDGTVSLLAGSLDQTSGNTDGLGNDASFFGPTGITRDASGTLYVVDAINNRIRKILPDGTVVTLAGSTAGFQNGAGSSAQFNFLYATNP